MTARDHPPATAGKGPLSAEIVDAEIALTVHEPAWRALARAASATGCFATPSFFRAWHACLSADVEPAVVIARSGDALRGVMPVMLADVRRGPRGVPRHDFAPSDRAYLNDTAPRPLRLRQLSPVVSMPATLTGPAPLCRAGDLPAVTGAIARALVARGGWDVIAVPANQGAQQQAWIAALRDAGLAPWVHRLDRHVRGIARLAPFDAIVTRQNKKFRQNIRRARAAAEEAGLAFSDHEGREAVAGRLAVLAEVARASWKDTRAGELTIPYSGAQQRFFETLIRDPRTEAEITPILSVARTADGPAAVLLSILHADVLTAVITFHNSRVPRASPGMLLLGRMIDRAAERGLARYDLNATHPWVRKLADTSRAEDIVVAFGPTLRGRAAGLVSRTVRKLRP